MKSLDQILDQFDRLTDYEKALFREELSNKPRSIRELQGAVCYWTQLWEGRAFLFFGVNGLMPVQIVEEINDVSAEAYPHLSEALYDTARRLEDQFCRLADSGRVPIFQAKPLGFKLRPQTSEEIEAENQALAKMQAKLEAEDKLREQYRTGEIKVEPPADIFEFLGLNPDGSSK